MAGSISKKHNFTFCLTFPLEILKACHIEADNILGRDRRKRTWTFSHLSSIIVHVWVWGTNPSGVLMSPSLSKVLVLFSSLCSLSDTMEIWSPMKILPQHRYVWSVSPKIRHTSVCYFKATHTPGFSPHYCVPTGIPTRTWLTFEIVVSFNFSMTGTSIWLLVICPKWILIEKQNSHVTKRGSALLILSRKANRQSQSKNNKD